MLVTFSGREVTLEAIKACYDRTQAIVTVGTGTRSSACTNTTLRRGRVSLGFRRRNAELTRELKEAAEWLLL